MHIAAREQTFSLSLLHDMMQVLGHSKTVIVLFCSWLLFSDSLGPMKLVGVALALGGMGYYTYLKSRPEGKETRQGYVEVSTSADERNRGLNSSKQDEDV